MKSQFSPSEKLDIDVYDYSESKFIEFNNVLAKVFKEYNLEFEINILDDKRELLPGYSFSLPESTSTKYLIFYIHSRLLKRFIEQLDIGNLNEITKKNKIECLILTDNKVHLAKVLNYNNEFIHIFSFNNKEQLQILAERIFYNTVLYNWNLYLEGKDIAAARILECKYKKSNILDLSNLALTEISKTIKLVEEHVEYLRLGNNYYDNETHEFVFAERKYGENSISSIEPIRNFNKLKGLYLANNYMASSTIVFFNIINTFKSLEHLDLYDNGFFDTNPNLRFPKSLKVLDLSRNSINYSWITGLPNLEELDLNDMENWSMEILDEISYPEKLKKLYISWNKITEIDELLRLTNLEILDISNNKITEIEKIFELKNLKKLHLYLNPIKDCPTDIKESGDIALMRRYFSIKEIADKEFTKELSNVDKEVDGKYIRPKLGAKNFEDIPENRFKEPIEPFTPTKDDFPYIPTHPFTPEKTKIRNKHLKIIILGNSNAGKSNLVEYLKTGIYTGVRDSTHGLNIERWLPDDASLSDVEINIWDFGGQEYYHETYRLFLSANVLYIVVWEDLTKKNEDKSKPKEDTENFDLEYWLETIAAHTNTTNTEQNPSTKSRILVVQNKVDDIEQNKVLVDSKILEQYHVKNSYHISLKHGSVVANTRQAANLNYFISELTHELCLMAASEGKHDDSWVKMRNQYIEAQEGGILKGLDYHINRITFYAKIREIFPNMEEDNFQVLEFMLKNSGKIVHYNDIEQLKDTYFIDPKELSTAIHGILSKKLLDNNGKLDTKWNEENKFIKHILLHLDLIFMLKENSSDSYIAPQYLSVHNPNEDLFKLATFNTQTTTFWIKLPMYYYKKIIHHLIVYYIKEENTTAKYYWKNGIYFIYQDTKVLIRGETCNKENHGYEITLSIENVKNFQAIATNLFNTIYAYKLHKRGEDTKNQPSNMIQDKIEISLNDGVFYPYKYLMQQAESIMEHDISELPLSTLYKFNPAINNTIKKTPKKVFICYAHDDLEWMRLVENHLSALRRSGVIEIWTDFEIRAGMIWDDKIKAAMEEADVFICLLSASFISSEYIWNTELKTIIEKKKNNRSKVIPVYIHSFDIEGLNSYKYLSEKQETTLYDFQIIPIDEGKLKAASSWQNKHDALTAIVTEIRKVIVR